MALGSEPAQRHLEIMIRNMDAYRIALLERQAALEQSLRSRDDIAVERAPDEVEAIQLAQERDLAISEVDRETQQLRAIKSALNRLSDGTYGDCLRCDKQINEKRLAAVPWAAYCIVCQEEVDRENGNGHLSNGHCGPKGEFAG
jgi:DnaK suppressor protein